MNHTPHDRTQFIIGILGLIAVVLVVVFVRPGEKDISAPTKPDDATLSEAMLWPSTFQSEETFTDNTAPYTIAAKYPVTSSAAINARFKTFVDAQIASFKDDTAWATEPGASSASIGELSLDITYVNTRTARADNYIFTMAQYTGGAHGLQVTTTFVYDHTGTPVTLDTLFTSGIAGLATLAPYVQKELAQRQFTDAKWVAEGAAPTAENYRNFTITDTGITFMFDPYQVAAYAAGIQKVTVPLSVFKDIANKTLFPIQ